MREGGRVGTGFRRKKYLYRPSLQHGPFLCAQLYASRISFLSSEPCFSIRRLWDDYRYGGQSTNDTRHLGWVARVSVNFQVFRNTERPGLGGKVTIVAVSRKCGTKLCPDHALQSGAIAVQTRQLHLNFQLLTSRSDSDLQQSDSKKKVALNFAVSRSQVLTAPWQRPDSTLMAAKQRRKQRG